MEVWGRKKEAVECILEAALESSVHRIPVSRDMPTHAHPYYDIQLINYMYHVPVSLNYFQDC